MGRYKPPEPQSSCASKAPQTIESHENVYRSVHRSMLLRVSILLAAMSAAAASQAILIDDFSLDQAGKGGTNGETDQQSGSLLIAPGVARTLYNTIVSSTGVGGFSHADVKGGVFDFNTDPRVTATANVGYNFIPTVNLSATPRIQLDFLSNNVAQTASIMVADRDLRTSLHYGAVAASASPFSATIDLTGSGVDLTRVLVLFVTFNPGVAGSDLKLDRIQATPVPEPASMAALGLGALSLLRRRKS